MRCTNHDHEGPDTDEQWRDVGPCETLRGIAAISSMPTPVVRFMSG